MSEKITLRQQLDRLTYRTTITMMEKLVPLLLGVAENPFVRPHVAGFDEHKLFAHELTAEKLSFSLLEQRNGTEARPFVIEKNFSLPVLCYLSHKFEDSTIFISVDGKTFALNKVHLSMNETIGERNERKGLNKFGYDTRVGNLVLLMRQQTSLNFMFDVFPYRFRRISENSHN